MPARSPLWLSCCTLAALPALLLGDAVLHREVTPDDRLPFMDIHVKRMTEPVNAGLTRFGFVLRRDAAGATPEMAYLEVFDDAPPPHGRGRRQFLAWLEVRKRPLEDVWYVEVIAAEVYWRQGHVVIGYGLPNRPTTTPTATPAPPTTAPSASGMWTVPLARFAPRKARPRPRARNASARDRRQREN